MKNKIIQIAAIILIVLFIQTGQVEAYSIVSESSATMSNNKVIEKGLFDSDGYQIKRLVIQSVLKRYNSPLYHEVDTFIKACYVYNIDCYLLPSISGLESQFGKYIYPNSYNSFGWGGGHTMFNSWGEGIMIVAKGLRNNYINKGAHTVSQIGRIYAPPSSTWARNVTYFIKIFNKEEQKLQLVSNLI